MREYSFELEINSNNYMIQGKSLPLVKSLWLMKKLASLIAPLLAGFSEESKKEDLSNHALTALFSEEISEKEIADILATLAYSLKVSGLNDPTYQNFELVAKNGDISGLEMVFAGDSFALFSLGKEVIKQNFGDMGKFLTRLSTGNQTLKTTI